jgi:hypothetical protein
MTKFVVYEKVAEAIFARLDKNSLSQGQQTGVNLFSGLMAGFAAAIVSRPRVFLVRAPCPASSRSVVSSVSVDPSQVSPPVSSWLVV